MKQLVCKHPRAIRWFHWINVPLLYLMIVSGILIYWADDVYRIGWGPVTLFAFFPDWFYRLFDLHHRLSEGMAWHFAIMWLFTLNGVCYVTYVLWSGEWQHLVPDRHSFRDAWQVVRHDMGWQKELPAQGKFNAAQKFAYTGVICMGGASVLSGFAISKPTQLSWLTNCFGGYQAARAFHFALTIGFVLFICIHVAHVIRAGWNSFRAMITGYEIGHPETPEQHIPAPLGLEVSAGQGELSRDPTSADIMTRSVDAFPLSHPDAEPRIEFPVAEKTQRSLDRAVELQMDVLTRRCLMTGLLSGTAGFVGYSWLNWLAFDKAFDSQLQWPFRRMHQFNQWVSQQVLGTKGLAPQFPQSLAREPRPNGRVGLKSRLDLNKWQLHVANDDQTLRAFRLDEIQSLPKTEMVTELNCVEGWSEIVHWGGVRLSDFLSHYHLGRVDGQPWTDLQNIDQMYRYVQLSTPDDGYYVGLDVASALHPQTLLCYEMNGQPLTPEHGAPLRLVITVKYGIKNIKRIGKLTLTNQQPADYWAERGYDWYAGL